MKITTIGRGTIGGILAELWESAGHEVTRLGHEGGDASDADVVLLAVPSKSVPEALAGVAGLDGKIVLDASNVFAGGAPPAGHDSVGEYVKATTGGPTAKAFNLNFGDLYPRAAGLASRPGNIWVGDEEAREAVERLSADIGMEAVHAGPLDRAAAQEAFAELLMSISKDHGGLIFYRFDLPEKF